jgi:hypothetical protein
MSKLRSSNRRGFTLVELLVVVAVQVALQSFIEQGCLFGELSDTAVGGVGNTDIAANVNGQVFDGQQVNVLSCPASPLPQMSNPLTTTPQGVMMPTHIGISEAATRGGGPNPDAEPTVRSSPFTQTEPTLPSLTEAFGSSVNRSTTHC